MRIEMLNGKVVCRTDDWKALEENEQKFLSSESWTMTWVWGKDEFNGMLVMRECPNAKSRVTLLHNTFYHAKESNVEITDETSRYLSDQYQAALAEEDLKRREKEAIRRRQSWKYRQEQGCDGCEFNIQIGDGDFKCGYSGDMLDSQFMSIWNVEHKCEDIFHETGIPNAHCKDFYKEEIKLRGESYGKI